MTAPGNAKVAIVMGKTNPDNPNRHKQHGYQTRRDPGGAWHTYRPDGTRIT